MAIFFREEKQRTSFAESWNPEVTCRSRRGDLGHQARHVRRPHQAQGLVADKRLFGSAVSSCAANTLSSVTAGVQLMRSWLARGTRQMEYAATRWLDKLFWSLVSPNFTVPENN